MRGAGEFAGPFFTIRSSNFVREFAGNLWEIEREMEMRFRPCAPEKRSEMKEKKHASI